MGAIKERLGSLREEIARIGAALKETQPMKKKKGKKAARVATAVARAPPQRPPLPDPQPIPLSPPDAREREWVKALGRGKRAARRRTQKPQSSLFFGIAVEILYGGILITLALGRETKIMSDSGLQIVRIPIKTTAVAFRAVEGQAGTRDSLMQYIGIPGCCSLPRLVPGDFGGCRQVSFTGGGQLAPSPSTSLLWANRATPSAHLPRGPRLITTGPRPR